MDSPDETPPPVPHRLELAGSGRSKCRACGESIAKGELRFGEVLPNPFTGHATAYWFHVECAVLKRPEPLHELLEQVPHPALAAFQSLLESGRAHPRLTRLKHAEQASSGRAKCRHCEALIEKGALRCSIEYYEDGRFSPGGFVHWTCVGAYCNATPEPLRLARLGASEAEPLPPVPPP